MSKYKITLKKQPTYKVKIKDTYQGPVNVKRLAKLPDPNKPKPLFG